jgi:hypothetical protein
LLFSGVTFDTGIWRVQKENSQHTISISTDLNNDFMNCFIKFYISRSNILNN